MTRQTEFFLFGSIIVERYHTEGINGVLDAIKKYDGWELHKYTPDESGESLLLGFHEWNDYAVITEDEYNTLLDISNKNREEEEGESEEPSEEEEGDDSTRECCKCDKVITQGHVVNDVDVYCDECFKKSFTKEEAAELHEEEAHYYTSWGPQQAMEVKELSTDAAMEVAIQSVMDNDPELKRTLERAHDDIKLIPDGLEDWAETHFVVTEYIVKHVGINEREESGVDTNVVVTTMIERGQGGLWELAFDWTNRFTKATQNMQWGVSDDFNEILTNFLDDINFTKQ